MPDIIGRRVRLLRQHYMMYPSLERRPDGWGIVGVLENWGLYVDAVNLVDPHRARQFVFAQHFEFIDGGSPLEELQRVEAEQKTAETQGG